MSAANLTRFSTEHHFQSWDGSKLFYRHWPAGIDGPSGNAVILFHGGHEHSGRFQELVEKLDQESAHIFAWDARGHGRSPGTRGYARHFMDLVRDADAFVHHIRDEYGVSMEGIGVLGHSVGSVIAATWVHDYAPPIRAMVLGSPAFDVKLYVPLAKPGLRLIQCLHPDAFVNSYVKPGMLTHDREEAEARRQDPLITPAIAVRVLNSLYDTVERVLEGTGSIQVPTLLLSAGRDHVVHRAPQRRFFETLGTREKELHTLEGFYHEVFHETNRALPTGLARRFLTEQQKGLPANLKTRVSPANEERYRELTRPLSPLNPKRYLYSAMTLAMRLFGGLSRGMRIGLESGFDSGPMLDYVYRNEAQGIGALGRMVDRIYLESAGWRGIRRRRVHLKQALNAAIDQAVTCLPTGQPIHIVDLASGPGRYLLEVLQERSTVPNAIELRATCRDHDERGLLEGRKLAHSLGLNSVWHIPGDAFSPQSIAAIEPRPDIVIVSGLYELFSDNRLILRSLHAIRALVPEHAQLLFTNQPWHPQLELIARTLPNRDGEPWVMRPRAQAEMNALVRAAGFEPGPMFVDDTGIFTVTRAAVAPAVTARRQAA